MENVPHVSEDNIYVAQFGGLGRRMRLNTQKATKINIGGGKD